MQASCSPAHQEPNPSFDTPVRAHRPRLGVRCRPDSPAYGTHSMRRTKAAQIYRKTGSLRAVQLLLGHRKLESTVRYLGIEVDDALGISEQLDL
ncbi:MULTISPECIES: tyrosine-type recombinase/integrase [unclassified Inquilinus]|uniref:tyrosine-type recombinase/integrase n=1 Tax=unclassified Inquilinus TaxID=2645927 RepID=UPI003F90CEC1